MNFSDIDSIIPIVGFVNAEVSIRRFFAKNHQKNEKTAPSGAALPRMGQVCIEEAGKK